MVVYIVREYKLTNSSTINFTLSNYQSVKKDRLARNQPIITNNVAIDISC